MRGVVVNAGDPANMPSARRLKTLGATGVRQVLFPDGFFKPYVTSLVKAGLSWAACLPRESFPDGTSRSDMVRTYAEELRLIPPSFWLIGNEPAAVGESSWTMTPDEYLTLWNEVVPALRFVLPRARFVVGGMLGPAGWLDPIWDRLDPTPDALDIHYPDTEELVSWKQYGVPLTCMEWAWAGARVKRSDVVAWHAMLCRHTTDSAWFRFGEGPDAPGMGLCSAGGSPKKAFYDYQEALK